MSSLFSIQIPTTLISTLLATFLFLSPLSANALVIWANNGEDKVTQDELRATANPSAVTNSVWDGNKIKLFGARNEVASFCLLLESPTQAATNISVEFNTLTGPGGKTIQSRSASGNGVLNWVDRPIELYYVRYLQIKGIGQLLYEDYDERHIPERLRRPWTDNGFAVAGTGWADRPDHDKFYPDIAVPLELKPRFSIAKGQNQCVWVDIYIPKSATAGRYTGSIKVDEGGKNSLQIPVDLSVRNFTLPDEPSLKTMLVVGYEGVNQRYINEAYPNSPADLETSRKVLDKHFQMAHRHRISLIGGEEDAKDQPNANWGPRLSGELFTPAKGYDGPGIGLGNKIYSVGLYSKWTWKKEGEAGMHAHTDAWVNWFNSHAPDTDYFLYLIDESDNLPQIEQWASWIKTNSGPGKHMPSFATMDILNGINQTPSLDIPCAANYHATTSEVSAAAQQLLADPDKHLCQYNGLRPYTGSFSTEDDGVALRVTAWSQFKKKVDFNWFYWASTYYDNYQGGMGQTNVFNSAFTFGAISGQDSVAGETGWNYSNGDGVLFYPGTDKIYPTESYGIDGPIASLRLKHWRRGIQDGDYLTLAAAINPAAVNKIVARMMPKALWEYGVDEPSDPSYVRTDISWSTDPDEWETARAELANIIEGNAPEQGYPLAHNQWRQISLPCDPGANNTTADIFGDDELGTYGTDWRLWAYDTAINKYVDSGLNGTLKQGVGYWIVQINGSTKTLDMPKNCTPTPASQSATCPSAQGCYPIPLPTRENSLQWSIIGYPYTATKSLGNARVVSNAGGCENGCDLNTAESNGITHNQLWTYTGGNNYSMIENDDNLSPWTSYWLPTLKGAHGKKPLLLIPKP
jgi:hypothetical protein